MNIRVREGRGGVPGTRAETALQLMEKTDGPEGTAACEAPS